MADHLRKALSRHISRREQNAVLARCRGKCVYYGCDQSLVVDTPNGTGYWVGEFAHIYSFSDKGPLPLPQASRRREPPRNRNLRAQRADHYTLGLDLALGERNRLVVEALR
jgi:hypothetical protein